MLCGSSSALNSNKMIIKALQDGLVAADLPEESIQLVEDECIYSLVAHKVGFSNTAHIYYERPGFVSSLLLESHDIS